jgi:hypothetical protein
LDAGSGRPPTIGDLGIVSERAQPFARPSPTPIVRIEEFYALFSAGLEAGLDLLAESDLEEPPESFEEPPESDDPDEEESDEPLVVAVSLLAAGLSFEVVGLPRESVR